MLELMIITNDEKYAKIIDNTNIDTIFIDLEINGKEVRQAGLNSVISKHQISDVAKIKKVIKNTQLMVRVNSMFEGSEAEINAVIDSGADIIMLPYFKTVEEVQKFIKIVDGRCKVRLLLETKEAVEVLDEILKLGGIDSIHIGLNDLSISNNYVFMFEPLLNGMVENICNKIKAKGLKYGFGGIAKLGYGDVPAENIIIEHYRLQSSMAILSRTFISFDDTLDNVEEQINRELKKIRDLEASIDSSIYIENRKVLEELIEKVIERKKHEIISH